MNDFDKFVFVCIFQEFVSLKRRQGVGEMRKIRLNKGPEEGLGMSITVTSNQIHLIKDQKRASACL